MLYFRCSRLLCLLHWGRHEIQMLKSSIWTIVSFRFC